MVGDEEGVQYDVAIDLHDVVAFGLCYCFVANRSQAEAFVLLPNVFNAERRLASEFLNYVNRRVSRTVVGDNYFEGHPLLAQNAL
jgi:hypothetical protein